MQLFTSQDINWWTGVVWITCGLLWCFYQLLRLILTAPIRCRVSNGEKNHVMLNFSISLLMKKQTNLYRRWSEGEYILQNISANFHFWAILLTVDIFQLFCLQLKYNILVCFVCFLLWFYLKANIMHLHLMHLVCLCYCFIVFCFFIYIKHMFFTKWLMPYAHTDFNIKLETRKAILVQTIFLMCCFCMSVHVMQQPLRKKKKWFSICSEIFSLCSFIIGDTLKMQRKES